MSRTASHAPTAPPPSSIAPCPTSHESMWPPSTTTSSGFSRPTISAITLRDGASGSLRAPMRRVSTTGSPRSWNRCSIMASSTLSAAAGILAVVESYRVWPVWGLRIEFDATDRMRQATAPTRAAADGPSVRTGRVAT